MLELRRSRPSRSPRHRPTNVSPNWPIPFGSLADARTGTLRTTGSAPNTSYVRVWDNQLARPSYSHRAWPAALIEDDRLKTEGTALTRPPLENSTKPCNLTSCRCALPFKSIKLGLSRQV